MAGLIAFGVRNICLTFLVSFMLRANAQTVTGNGVQNIIVPMCQNFLHYNQTTLPNDAGHASQVEVYRHIEHFWPYMDYGCSVNFRQFVCSLYLPRYDVQDGAVTGPCKEMCNHAKRKCKKVMKDARFRWPQEWRCNRLTSIRRNRDANCFGPWREPRVRRNQNQMHMYCSPITLDQCQDLHYVLGSLPNRYLQRNISEIQVELNYYNPLIATSCHANLRLFLCGTFNPFCVHNENPFTTPCREFCEEVEGSCADSFALLYGGLPWPNKLQCHRFPAAESGESAHCFMPNDLTISR